MNRVESIPPQAQTSEAYCRPLTPREAGQYLGLDDKTITRWARQGYLPGHPLGAGKKKYWRFFLPELTTWMSVKNNWTVME